MDIENFETLNKVIEEGCLSSFQENNNKLLEKTDPAAVEELVNEQIELLGSELLYHRINNNFLELKFEAFFAKEQFKLFTWRENFFYNKFGNIYDGTLQNWITCGALTMNNFNNYIFETVPYHITMNFNEVMALACSTDYRPYNGSYVFFENDKELSSRASAMFNPKPISIWNQATLSLMLSRSWYSLLKNELENGIIFKDVAHKIMALHGIGPCTLLEAAMKTVLLHHLPIQDIPKELQQKSRLGLYSDDVRDPVPSNLSQVGWTLFCRYRDEFSAVSGDGDLGGNP